MSQETLEFLVGLYGPHPEPHPHPWINWTRGFEATEDEQATFLLWADALEQAEPRLAARPWRRPSRPGRLH